MIAVVAGNYGEFREWLEKQFVYIGDKMDIEKLNPAEVEHVLFVGNSDKHPLYFSDDLLKFQFQIALASTGKDLSLVDELFKRPEGGEHESSDS